MDHALQHLLKFESWERDSILIDGHRRREFFLEYVHRYSWKDSMEFFTAWREAATCGSQLRQDASSWDDSAMERLWMWGQDQGWNSDHVMTPEELQAFNGMQFPLTVFRGVALAEGAQLSLEEPGSCWTLDQSKAEWFAKRAGDQGSAWLLTAKVQRADVLAYLGEREEEVMLIPECTPYIDAEATRL
ncbi:hypothetical protein OAF30_03030 [Flavobacteriales bacterium]|nr:hypothetical protein [Flavobacteriales bacterium]